jgi:WW domain
MTEEPAGDGNAGLIEAGGARAGGAVMLAPGWVELVDPATGATYYYHEQSQQTTWERPLVQDGGSTVVGIAGGDSIGTGASSDALEATTTAAEEEYVLPPPEMVAADDRVPVPVSLEDTTADEPVVREEEDKVVKDTSSLPPNGAAPTPNDVDVADDSVPPPPLPDGWQECQDPSSGLFYYFHKGTNVTQWDRPGAPTHVQGPTSEDKFDGAEDVSGAVGDAINHVNASENPQESTLPASDDSAAPEASTTPSTPTNAHGSGYDQPPRHRHEDCVGDHAPIGSPPLSSLMSEPMIATPLVAGSTAKSTAPPVPSALPEGWQELVDEASGQVYYYHAENGATTWELPVEQMPDASISDGEVMFTGSPAVMDRESSVVSPQGSESESPGASLAVDLEPVDSVGEVQVADAFPGNSGAPEMSCTDAAAEMSYVDAAPVELPEALPEGWIEALDEATGQVYYYNAAHNTTSWERPTAESGELKFSRQPEEEEASPIDVSATGGECEEVSGGHNTPSRESEALPDGWQELQDTTSGRVYYYHAADDVTTWEKPKIATDDPFVQGSDQSASPEGTGHVEQDLVMPLEKDSSPRGQSHDREEASDDWNPPSSQPSDNVMAQYATTNDDGVPGESENEYQEQTTEQSEGDLPHAHLPEGWEEVLDEATGSVYYYNAIEDVSTWSRPAHEVGADRSATVNQGPAVQPDTGNEDGEPLLVDDDIRGSADHVLRDEDVEEDDSGGVVTPHVVCEMNEDGIPPSSSRGPILPDGWEEVVDEDTGAVYFYNAGTDTAAWERPDSSVPEPVAPENQREVVTDEDSPELQIESEPELDAHSMVEADDLPAGWEELVDEATGQVYYFCEQTQVSQWVRPGPSDAVASSDDAIPTTTSGEPESAPEQTESDALPEGWVEMKDESSGLPYYVHDDGTSTWDRPVPSSLSEDLVGSVPSSDHAQVETEVTPEAVSAPESMEVPPEWTEPIDLNSPGDNENESAMSEPVNVEDTSEEMIDVVSALPLGWVELVDPTTSRTYFFNEETNETTWDWPVVHVGSHGDRSMPDVWEELVDESTGQTYYFNSETGESSWDRPQTSSSARASSSASYATAGRPAHAIATFGFGGRLCLVRRGSSIVSIRRTGTLVVDSAVLDVEKAKMEAEIYGPLSSADAKSVLLYMKRRSAVSEEQRRMLWKLIMIAAGANGKLRSDRSADDSQSPEAAVLGLLRDLARSTEMNGDCPAPLVRSASLTGTCVSHALSLCGPQTKPHISHV